MYEHCIEMRLTAHKNDGLTAPFMGASALPHKYSAKQERVSPEVSQLRIACRACRSTRREDATSPDRAYNS
jgi:hypothetical protein